MSALLRSGSAAAARAKAGPVADDPFDAAFDRWLRRELSRLYGAMLAEPLPPHLTALLRPAGAEQPAPGRAGQAAES